MTDQEVETVEIPAADAVTRGTSTSGLCELCLKTSVQTSCTELQRDADANADRLCAKCRQLKRCLRDGGTSTSDLLEQYIHQLEERDQSPDSDSPPHSDVIDADVSPESNLDLDYDLDLELSFTPELRSSPDVRTPSPDHVRDNKSPKTARQRAWFGDSRAAKPRSLSDLEEVRATHAILSPRRCDADRRRRHQSEASFLPDLKVIPEDEVASGKPSAHDVTGVCRDMIATQSSNWVLQSMQTSSATLPVGGQHSHSRASFDKSSLVERSGAVEPTLQLESMRSSSEGVEFSTATSKNRANDETEAASRAKTNNPAEDPTSEKVEASNKYKRLSKHQSVAQPASTPIKFYLDSSEESDCGDVLRPGHTLDSKQMQSVEDLKLESLSASRATSRQTSLLSTSVGVSVRTPSKRSSVTWASPELVLGSVTSSGLESGESKHASVLSQSEKSSASVQVDNKRGTSVTEADADDSGANLHVVNMPRKCASAALPTNHLLTSSRDSSRAVSLARTPERKTSLSTRSSKSATVATVTSQRFSGCSLTSGLTTVTSETKQGTSVSGSSALSITDTRDWSPCVVCGERAPATSSLCCVCNSFASFSGARDGDSVLSCSRTPSGLANNSNVARRKVALKQQVVSSVPLLSDVTTHEGRQSRAAVEVLDPHKLLADSRLNSLSGVR